MKSNILLPGSDAEHFVVQNENEIKVGKVNSSGKISYNGSPYTIAEDTEADFHLDGEGNIFISLSREIPVEETAGDIPEDIKTVVKISLESGSVVDTFVFDPPSNMDTTSNTFPFMTNPDDANPNDNIPPYRDPGPCTPDIDDQEIGIKVAHANGYTYLFSSGQTSYNAPGCQTRRYSACAEYDFKETKSHEVNTPEGNNCACAPGRPCEDLINSDPELWEQLEAIDTGGIPRWASPELETDEDGMPVIEDEPRSKFVEVDCEVEPNVDDNGDGQPDEDEWGNTILLEGDCYRTGECFPVCQVDEITGDPIPLLDLITGDPITEEIEIFYAEPVAQTTGRPEKLTKEEVLAWMGDVRIPAVTVIDPSGATEELTLKPDFIPESQLQPEMSGFKDATTGYLSDGRQYMVLSTEVSSESGIAENFDSVEMRINDGTGSHHFHLDNSGLGSLSAYADIQFGDSVVALGVEPRFNAPQVAMTMPNENSLQMTDLPIDWTLGGFLPAQINETFPLEQGSIGVSTYLPPTAAYNEDGISFILTRQTQPDENLLPDDPAPAAAGDKFGAAITATGTGENNYPTFIASKLGSGGAIEGFSTENTLVSIGKAVNPDGENVSGYGKALASVSNSGNNIADYLIVGADEKLLVYNIRDPKCFGDKLVGAPPEDPDPQDPNPVDLEAMARTADKAITKAIRTTNPSSPPKRFKASKRSASLLAGAVKRSSEAGTQIDSDVGLCLQSSSATLNMRSKRQNRNFRKHKKKFNSGEPTQTTYRKYIRSAKQTRKSIRECLALGDE